MSKNFNRGYFSAVGKLLDDAMFTVAEDLFRANPNWRDAGKEDILRFILFGLVPKKDGLIAIARKKGEP